jgi:hypothetical protein
VNNCPTCGAPKPNEAWHWGESEKNLFAAAPALLAGLTAAIEAINEASHWEDTEECGSMLASQEWFLEAVRAINKAKGEK